VKYHVRGSWLSRDAFFFALAEIFPDDFFLRVPCDVASPAGSSAEASRTEAA
jgi:hypothetical protein